MALFEILGWLVVIILVIVALSGIKINAEWERRVILRLGRYVRTASAGLLYVIPVIERGIKLDTRTQVMDVERQSIITKDSVTVEVDAVVYYKIKTAEAEKAVLNVEHWEEAATTLAQTTLRDIVGKNDLDALLTDKDKIGDRIQAILDRATDPWGIKIEAVEVKDVIIPKNMERAMAKEAEALREKRARVTKSEGEVEAAKQFKRASDLLAKGRNAMTLRQLQTWQEIGAEQNSLIIVVPTDMDPDKAISLAALGRQQLGKGIKKGSK